MLKGRSFPGKVLLTRRSEPLSPPDYSPRFENENDEDERKEGSQEVMCYQFNCFRNVNDIYCKSVTDEVVIVQGEGQSPGNSFDNAGAKKSNLLSASSSNLLPDAQGLVSGARATDSARIAKFTTELSRPAVILGIQIILCNILFGVHHQLCVKQFDLRSKHYSNILIFSMPDHL